MTTENRTGDIAMVDDKPAVWMQAESYAGWKDLECSLFFLPNAEVGPVLGNVADIATAHVGTESVSVATDLALEAWVARAKADGLREAADNLYLSDEGQHNEAAKAWLHRRANLIDPRTRGSVCEHGNQTGYCGYCTEEAP